MTPSIALAEAIAGSEDCSAQMMNREAKRLGLTQHQLHHATGLSMPQLYSTAQDLAQLVVALIRDYPEYYPLYSQKEYRLTISPRPTATACCGWIPRLTASRPVYTKMLVTASLPSARRGDRRLVSVVLGTASESSARHESQNC